MMKTCSAIAIATILLAVSGRADVIKATVDLGQINDSATWGGATLPTAGNTGYGRLENKTRL
jgi:hypothetical protein